MRVALTGATGFLGLHLMPGLVERHGELLVLARGDSAPALPRITSFLRMNGIPENEIHHFLKWIHIVEVDVGAPRLGLSQGEFRALADDLEVIWHSAGNINLHGSLSSVRSVNVEGLRNVLELASGRRSPMVNHISTAFVAGARRTGVIAEGDLTADAGFENPYERSKYEAEVLLRNWSARHGRPARVFRPSVLITDLPAHPDLPGHPLRVIVEQLREVARLAEHDGPLRLAGDPGAHLNLMPVADAVTALLSMSAVDHAAGVETRHVVHGHDVGVADILTALERSASVRLDLVGEVPADPSPAESAIAQYQGFLCYLWHRRTYAGGCPEVEGTPVDLDYLLAGMPQPVGVSR
jgi:nucleoside-diphosphate-sugar epimerase